MITVLRRGVTCNIWVATFNVKVTEWHCSKSVSLTLLLEVGFYNYLTEMITIIIKMRWHYLAQCLDPVVTYKVLKVRFTKHCK